MTHLKLPDSDFMIIIADFQKLKKNNNCPPDKKEANYFLKTDSEKGHSGEWISEIYHWIGWMASS